MKNKTITIVTICTFTVLLSCQTNKENHVDNKNANIINIDSSINEDTAHLSQFIKHKKYISLETEDNCLIENISKIRIYDNRIFILDPYSDQKMLVFDLTGKFLYAISEKGKGPGKYGDIFDFIVQNDKIYILNNRSSVMEFKLNGTYIKTYQLPFWVNQFLRISSEKWGLITNSDKSHGHNFNFYITKNDFTQKKGLIKSRFDDFPVSPFQQTCLLNDTNYFFLPFDNHIYYATNQGVKVKYEFQFPEDCILNDSQLLNLAKLSIRERVNEILDNTVFLSSMIFTNNLKIISFSKKRQKFTCFISEKNQTVIIPQKNIINDVDNLSISPTFYTNYESNKIIACFQSHELIKAMDSGEKINSDFKNHISELGENTNPIIAIYSTVNK